MPNGVQTTKPGGERGEMRETGGAQVSHPTYTDQESSQLEQWVSATLA